MCLVEVVGLRVVLEEMRRGAAEPQWAVPMGSLIVLMYVRLWFGDALVCVHDEAVGAHVGIWQLYGRAHIAGGSSAVLW